MVQEARRHPAGGDGGSNTRSRIPIVYHICVWKVSEPAIWRAAHVSGRVKWGFFSAVMRRRYLGAGLPGEAVGSTLPPGALCGYKIYN